MDSQESDPYWLDIVLRAEEDQNASTYTLQNEIAESGKVFNKPVHLFGQFVSAVPSDDLGDIEQSEISKFILDLCERAPSIAQHLVQEILKHLAKGSQPKAQVSKARGSSTDLQKSLKRRTQTDCTYQPPKSSAKQPTTSVAGQPGHDNKSINQSANSSITDTRPLSKCEHEIPETVKNVRQEGVKGQSMVDSSVPCQPDHDNMSIDQSSGSLQTEKTQYLQKCEEDISITIVEKFPKGGVQDPPATSSHNTSTELALYLPKHTSSSNSATGDEVHKQLSVAIDDLTENSQTTCLPSLPGEAEQRETALPETDGKASVAQAICSPQNLKPHKTTLLTPPLSNPIRQIEKRLQSPFSNDQTVTLNTTIFTPTVSRGVLLPMTEDDRTASPPEKADLALPGGVLTPLSSTGQQLTKLSNAALTQAQQVNREQQLSIQDRETTVPSSLTREVPTITDIVAKTIQIIHAISNRQELPTETHLKILSTLRPSLDITLTAPAVAEGGDHIWITGSSTSWSPSMWINILEAGEAHSRKAIILNMIERMGALKWYDAEHAEAKKEPSLIKKGRSRKRLASIILDKHLKEKESTAKASPRNRDSEDRSLLLNLASIQERVLNKRRKKLINYFQQGRTLRKLVQMTHLGILFDLKIGTFAKSSNENIDKIAASFQADPQKMALLSILDKQVELLVETGQPNLSNFFDSLESQAITTSEEILGLRAEYGLERELVPQGYLDAAIDRVVKRIGHDLGKETISDNDAMIVNSAVELLCGMFNRLRSKEWLHCWDIAAALEMTDRPVFTKLGLSIPLHKKDTNGKITPLPTPLRRWRTTIDDYKRDNGYGLVGPLVYFCPLNLNANHFTLLEINEHIKMIYHYDSMASHTIIHRKTTKSTLTRRQIEVTRPNRLFKRGANSGQEEFKYLNFGYAEVPTPQQNDGWSCGLMVIRNAKRRMNGLSVGNWSDKVDPDRVIMEVLGDCQTFLENDALEPSSKRKRVGECLPNDAQQPTRVSKRLKQINEGSKVAS